MNGTYARTSLFVLAVVAWFVSFALLARLGTWTPVALVGVALAAPLVQLRMLPSARLKPNRLNVGVGLFAGLVMVLLTHIAYRGLCALSPEVGASPARLMG